MLLHVSMKVYLLMYIFDMCVRKGEVETIMCFVCGGGLLNKGEKSIKNMEIATEIGQTLNVRPTKTYNL